MVPSNIIVHAAGSRTIIVDGDFEEGLIYEGKDIVGLDCTAPKYMYKAKVLKGGIIRLGKRLTPYLAHTFTLVHNGNTKSLIIETCPMTKSSIFLPPMLFENRSQLRWNTEFVNAYIDYEGSGDKLSICLLFRFNGTVSYAEFEEKLTRHPMYIDSIEPDKYHTLYRFSIPKSHVHDFTQIIEGRYSKLQDSYKRKILNFHTFSEAGETYGILYRTKQLQEEREFEYNLPEGSLDDAKELWDDFNIEEETYKNEYKLVTDVVKQTVG